MKASNRHDRSSGRTLPQEWKVSLFMKLIRENISSLEENYHVKKIGAFGSFIHNKQGKKSDFDILVEFHKPPSLFGFLELENYLSDVLGIKVDLVMKDSLKPHIGERIMNEVIYV